MRTFLISCCIFLTINLARARNFENAYIFVKLSTTDCNSCLLSLEKLNSLNQKIQLFFVLNSTYPVNTSVNSITAIINRPYEIINSDSLYDALKLSRSSYYLFGEKNLLDYGHMNEFDPVKAKLLGSAHLTFQLDTLARCDIGFNDLQVINANEFIVHNVGLNSILYFNVNSKQHQIWKGEDIDRLVVYKALNNGDSTYYWKNVLSQKEMLSKYNMFHLKFESISIKDSTLYVFSTINNVKDMHIGGSLKRVISPEQLVCQISLTNKQEIYFVGIDEPPKSIGKTYSIDNTQKIFPVTSSELMIPVYKDVLGKKNKIFAKYKRTGKSFQFDKLLTYELPESFIEDEMIYEGNYYQIKDGLLVFIASGDFIQLEAGHLGNFHLGKTVLVKVDNEYQKTIDWRVEGFKQRGNYIYLIFKESKVRKIAVYDITKQRDTVVYNTPEMFCNLSLSSNYSIAENGDIYFVSKEGFLLRI